MTGCRSGRVAARWWRPVRVYACCVAGLEDGLIAPKNATLRQPDMRQERGRQRPGRAGELADEPVSTRSTPTRSVLESALRGHKHLPQGGFRLRPVAERARLPPERYRRSGGVFTGHGVAPSRIR